MPMFIPALKSRNPKDDFRGGYESFASKQLSRIGDPSPRFIEGQTGESNIRGSRGRPIGRRKGARSSGNVYLSGPAKGLTRDQAMGKIRKKYGDMSDEERKKYEGRAYGSDIRSDREQGFLSGGGNTSRVYGGNFKPGKSTSPVARKKASGSILSRAGDAVKSAFGMDAAKPAVKRTRQVFEPLNEADLAKGRAATKASYGRAPAAPIEDATTAAYRRRDKQVAGARYAKGAPDRVRQAEVMGRKGYIEEERERTAKGNAFRAATRAAESAGTQAPLGFKQSPEVKEEVRKARGRARKVSSTHNTHNSGHSKKKSYY